MYYLLKSMNRFFFFSLLLFTYSFWVSPAVSADYTIGPGDVLSVSIFAGGEEQVAVDLAVSGQGLINAPFVGPVSAEGLATNELEMKLLTPLKQDFFVDPQVHVQVKEYHSLWFSISGAVKKPGKYEVQSQTTLMELIAKAEGATPERGNVAYVMREDTSTENGGPLKIDLSKLLDEGDMSHNLLLHSGDSVYIPLVKGMKQSDAMVFVSGKVKNPGLQEYQPGLTALAVCIMAGGFDEFAAPNRTTIVRTNGSEQEVFKVNLNDVIDGDIADFPLKAGDRVHVPESWL